MTAKKQKTTENIFKILITTDKFKGSLTSAQAADCIRKGILEKGRVLYFDIVEIADGGDGSASVVKKQADQGGKQACREVSCEAANPLGESIQTAYIRYGGTAFIEMARISGLALFPQEQRNPLETTTYGLGQVMLHALAGGAEEIILSIGGSATNDGGTGMLQALGFEFRDASGALIGAPYLCGKELERIASVCVPDSLLINGNGQKASLKVICDVTNPLLGPDGATWVYGAQKGAGIPQQQRLEAGMEQYVQAKILYPDNSPVASGFIEAPSCGNSTGSRILPPQFALFPGAGAAGGVGFAATCYLEGQLVSGWRFFAGITRLEERIAACDLVISGEGKVDAQSFQGKVIDGVSILARKHQKPLLLFCGLSELPDCPGSLPPNTYLYTLHSLEPNPERSMAHAGELLVTLAARAVEEQPELLQFHG